MIKLFIFVSSPFIYLMTMVFKARYWVPIFIILNFSCKKEVLSIKPQIKSITESVYASGIVKSKSQYNIYSTSSGIIKKIFVKEGDIVKKGEPLMIIQNQSVLLNRENAELGVQYNEYSKNEDKLTQIQKEISLAKNKLKADSLLMVRQNNLWSQGIGTKTEQEQRELSYQNAKTYYENLKLKLNEVSRQLKFASAQSKKNLQITNALLDDYTVRSEITGKVYSLLKEAGEIVSPQTQLGVIGDEKNFEIELQLDEYDIIKIKTGQEVILRMDSYSDTTFEARIDIIKPLMNAKTRTFTVVASFVRMPEVLYPNLSVEASIVLNKRDNTLTIPMTYVSNEKYVTLKDGTKREIKIGIKDYQLAEVLAGIDADTEIILSP